MTEGWRIWTKPKVISLRPTTLAAKLQSLIFLLSYSGVQNKRRVTFINFWAFIQGLCPYRRGLCLLFLPNVPGAMFIPVATSIPDSKVNHFMKPLHNSKQNIGETSYEGLTE